MSSPWCPPQIPERSPIELGLNRVYVLNSQGRLKSVRVYKDSRESSLRGQNPTLCSRLQPLFVSTFNNSRETASPALNSIRAFCSTPALRLGNIAVSRFEDEGRTEVRLDGGDGGGLEFQDLTGGNPLCLQCT